mgnify:CR=1 FL=1
MAMGRAERPAGLAIVEKLMGLILLVMGSLAIYYTAEAVEVLGPLWLLFVAFGSFLALVGLALILARAE